VWTGRGKAILLPKGKNRFQRSRSRRKRDQRREILAGYPVEPRPFTLAEIREYYSGEHIVCLRCGKLYRRISLHLPMIHGITEDQYREMYGLPWRRGLTSQESHNRYSLAVRRRMEDGWMPRTSVECLHAARQIKNRRQPFQREVCYENIAVAQGMIAHLIAHGRIGYPDYIFEEFLQRMVTGRTLREVSSDTDMPHESCIYARCKVNNQFAARLKMIGESLPFAVLARAESVRHNPKFLARVRALRARGLSDKRIAPLLGVSTMTVNKARRAHGIE